MLRFVAYFAILLIVFAFSANANTTYVAGGEIPSGLWLKQFSPYVVLDTIYLTNSNTLYIEYGCEILFDDDVVFYIENQAKLVAGVPRCPGSTPDSVWFTYLGLKGDTVVGWDGLRFTGAVNCTLKMCNINGIVVRGTSDYGAVSNLTSSLIIENCLIRDNIGGGNGGGGVYLETNRKSCIKNSKIIFNKTYGSGGGIYISAPDSIVISGNDVSNNELINGTKNGGGAFLKGSAVFVDNQFLSNRSRRDGGGLYVENYIGSIVRPKMFDNIAHRRGGGLAIRACSPTVLQADVCGNFSLATEGAAVYFEENSGPSLVNCIITHNDGGGVWSTANLGGVYSKLINCTVARNRLGPGLRLGYSFGGAKMLIFNTAIAYNLRTYTSCRQILLESTSDLLVQSSFVDNPAQVCNEGLGAITYLSPASFISGQPSFADTSDCNLGWLPSCAPVMSALIDAGTQRAVVAVGDTARAPSIDFLGNPRFMDAGFDIGAFENSCLGSRELIELPKENALVSVKPNPFNASLSVEFNVVKASEASIEIFDISGRRVVELWRGQVEPGLHEKKWLSVEMPSGIYSLRLTIGGEIFSEKVTLLK